MSRWKSSHAGEPARADEGAGDAGERQEVVGIAFVGAVGAGQATSQDMVRSMVHRCRPSRCEILMPLRAMRCRIPRWDIHCRRWL